MSKTIFGKKLNKAVLLGAAVGAGVAMVADAGPSQAAGHGCHPCAAAHGNPCAGHNPCNPCAAANPCAPCGACNPCNPCAAK